MKTPMKLFYVPLIMSLVSACASDDDDADNIVEVAQDNGSFTTLVTALGVTGLDAVLADESRDFTVFAPTDAAFAKLDPATLTALLNDPDALSDILLYHVLADTEVGSTAAIAAAGTTLTTANADDVGVALNGGDLFINSSQVIIPDVDASNGVIHAIDTVLIPTTDDPASGNIAQVATAAGNFTSLLGALTATGLDSVLTDPNGTFTVFAPTDAAFAAVDLSGLSVDQIEDILLYHVIVGNEVNASAATAIAGNRVQMGNGDNLALSLSGSELFANLSGVSTPDVDASNGIIHIIDTVLLPPAEATMPTQNIVETAIAAGDFTTLVAALQATGLDSTLADPNAEFTVFAPTDAAFNALPPGTVTDLLNDLPTLSAILTKHVVTGTVDSVTAFTLNGADVPTVNGETVALAIDSNEFTVDGAQVTTFDIQTSNGIIHVIDTVIQLD
ncbi:MAG: fasciclin domain-containing protein [Gammaproteobacteria bacterium]|nr:fasciclin domain-containing protein [Gammaproteobacteria bacterium]